TCSASSTRPSGSNSSSSGRRRSRAAASNDMRVSLPRATVIGVTALAVFLPLGLIFYQSLLNAPFFMPTKVGSGAFEFIFADSDFWDAFKNSLIIAGLTHVPHVYLYSSSSLKSLGSDVEEAARMAGSSPLQVAKDVSLPMVTPALLYSGVLVFFLGFEIFGLPLVLGDPEGHLVLATYLYKLTNKLGTPSYHLMAAVAVSIVAITFPLVLLQRWLLKSSAKYVSVKGKATRQKVLPLGGWKWIALAIVAAWLAFTIVVPISGIVLRSVVELWGEGVNLSEVLT